MRIPIMAALAAAFTLPALTAAPAMAQSPRAEYRDEVRDARRDYRRDVRRADDRGDVRRAQRDYRRDVRDARQDLRRDQRDWRQYRNFNYNRLERGQSRYYADRYYRDGSYYRPRALSRNDRIYRGQNGRFYCRRNDGTTGLIIGGLAGGTLGNIIAGGDSRLLGTLLGGAGGALLGRSIERGQVVCR